MTIQPTLIIVIATYNESQSLPSLVEEIRTCLPEAVILVVDDNSPDGTGDWVRKRGQRDSRLQLLHRENKEGLGAAAIAGIRQALSQKPEWIATMDADHSHRPQDLAKLWQAASSNRYDVIIGSRYVPGGRIEDWNWKRRLSSRAVNWFARWILWLRTNDNSGAFRIYRAESLKRINFQKIDCRGFAYLEQLLLHLQRSGATMREVPIVFAEREEGESKVSVSELFRNLRDIAWLAIRRG